MFYLYQGDVCVTPVGETVAEYKALKKRLLSRRNSDKLFVDTCKFLFFVYHKVDSLGNKNVYIEYPLEDRKRTILEKYNLYSVEKYGVEKLESITEYQDFLEFYLGSMYTETERSRDVIRAKIQHWRNEYQKVENSPEEDKAFADSLQLAQKLYQDYDAKVVLEETGEEGVLDGVPLYLFEIPESQKPVHIRLRYGDLANE